MGLVQDHQVAVHVFAAVHHIVELVSQDFRGADDDRGIGVLLGVARQDADLAVSEDMAEFDPLGVGEGLQRRSVPAAPSPVEKGPDRLLRDPGFSGPRRGHHQAVRLLYRPQGLALKWVWHKRRIIGPPDPGKNALQDRLRIRPHPGKIMMPGGLLMPSFWCAAGIVMLHSAVSRFSGPRWSDREA